MNTFDIVYISLLAFFFYRGWIKGFLKSCIGPACLAFWVIIGILNYDLNENIISASTITIVGSLVTSFIVHLALFFGTQTVHEQHRNYVFFGSRIIGGILNTAWNGIIIACISMLISLMPSNFLGLTSAQESIQKSISYNKFYNYLINPFPAVKNVHITIAILKNHRLLQKYKGTSEYDAVFSDPKIQYITQNSEIMKKIYSKDAISLLKNPHIYKILQDEFLMIKISNLSKKVFTERTEAE